MKSITAANGDDISWIQLQKIMSLKLKLLNPKYLLHLKYKEYEGTDKEEEDKKLFYYLRKLFNFVIVFVNYFV